MGARGAAGAAGGTQAPPQHVSGADSHLSEEEGSSDEQEALDEVSVIRIATPGGDEDIALREVFYECHANAPPTAGESKEETLEHRAHDLVARKDFDFATCKRLLELVCKTLKHPKSSNPYSTAA